MGRRLSQDRRPSPVQVQSRNGSFLIVQSRHHSTPESPYKAPIESPVVGRGGFPFGLVRSQVRPSPSSASSSGESASSPSSVRLANQVASAGRKDRFAIHSPGSSPRLTAAATVASRLMPRHGRCVLRHVCAPLYGRRCERCDKPLPFAVPCGSKGEAIHMPDRGAVWDLFASAIGAYLSGARLELDAGRDRYSPPRRTLRLRDRSRECARRGRAGGPRHLDELPAACHSGGLALPLVHESLLTRRGRPRRNLFKSSCGRTFTARHYWAMHMEGEAGVPNAGGAGPSRTAAPPAADAKGHAQPRCPRSAGGRLAGLARRPSRVGLADPERARNRLRLVLDRRGDRDRESLPLCIPGQGKRTATGARATKLFRAERRATAKVCCRHLLGRLEPDGHAGDAEAPSCAWRGGRKARANGSNVRSRDRIVVDGVTVWSDVVEIAACWQDLRSRPEGEAGRVAKVGTRDLERQLWGRLDFDE